MIRERFAAAACSQCSLHDKLLPVTLSSAWWVRQLAISRRSADCFCQDLETACGVSSCEQTAAGYLACVATSQSALTNALAFACLK
jgi:hypothetical protein